MKALPTKPPIICGAPASYGGLSSARKYSRVDLGAHGVCNRRVRFAGWLCYQHSDRVHEHRPGYRCPACGVLADRQAWGAESAESRAHREMVRQLPQDVRP